MSHFMGNIILITFETQRKPKSYAHQIFMRSLYVGCIKHDCMVCVTCVDSAGLLGLERHTSRRGVANENNIYNVHSPKYSGLSKHFDFFRQHVSGMRFILCVLNGRSQINLWLLTPLVTHYFANKKRTADLQLFDNILHPT